MAAHREMDELHPRNRSPMGEGKPKLPLLGWEPSEREIWLERGMWLSPPWPPQMQCSVAWSLGSSVFHMTALLPDMKMNIRVHGKAQLNEHLPHPSLACQNVLFSGWRDMVDAENGRSTADETSCLDYVWYGNNVSADVCELCRLHCRPCATGRPNMKHLR